MTLQLSREDKRFTGILILVHVFFFLLAMHYTRIYMGDSFEYIYEALNIKQYFFFYSGNAVMPITPEYMTQRQPLYPLFLLLVYLFTTNNWIVLVLQNIISILNIYYCRKIFTRLGYQKKYDWLPLLLVIAYPAQFINANTIAPDILLQSFTLLYVGNFIALLQKKNIKYAVWMGLALVAGMMVKPVLYPFVLVHIPIIIIATVAQKAKLQRPIAIALIPLCAVLFYNYWNYTRTEKFHFTSNQAFNAVYYYYSYFSYKEGADSANRFLQKERSNIAMIPEYKDRYDYANDRGMELLQQNFFPYMAFHLKHSLRILVEPGKAELDLFTGRLTYGRLYSKQQTGFFATMKNKGISSMSEYISNNPSLPIALLILIFNCARTIGLVLFFFRRNINIVVRGFLFILIGYFAVAAGPIANTRYFLPVSLLVISCAAMGYMGILQKRQTAL